MQTIALRQKSGAFCAVVICLLLGQAGLHGQPNAAVPTASAARPADLAQVELRESFERMQEQLHLTQLAIMKNRLDAETLAIAQNAAFAEKFDTIRTQMTAEQKRQQAVTDRADYARAQQQAEMQESHHTVVGIATVFGVVGLLAILFSIRFQRRTMTHLTEIGDRLPLLPAPAQAELLVSGTDLSSGPAVTQSNQRMLSAISRIEQRIIDLESSLPPFPAPPSNPATAKDKVVA